MNRISPLVILLLSTFCLSAVFGQDKPVLPVDRLPETIDLETIPRGLEQRPGVPSENPISPQSVALGRKLFFDPILSSDGTVSCASCHQPDHGFASPEALSTGVGGQKTKRNAPSILNRGYGTHFFWDGRAESLEKQAMGPLSNPAELGGDLPKVLAALKANPDYVEKFTEVFGDAPSSKGTSDDEDTKRGPRSNSIDDVVTIENACKAIANFERSLVSGNAPVDQFRGSEYSALNKMARQGMWIFESRGGCWKCHSGPTFSDEEFHNTGVSFGTADRDTGRFQFSGDEEDKFKFKTPSLRDVERTAPYMHDGSIKTLKEVVEFYNKGGSPKDPGLDSDMKPLNLTDEEVEFLVEFLKAMTGENRTVDKK